MGLDLCTAQGICALGRVRAVVGAQSSWLGCGFCMAVTLSVTYRVRCSLVRCHDHGKRGSGSESGGSHVIETSSGNYGCGPFHGGSKESGSRSESEIWSGSD